MTQTTLPGRTRPSNATRNPGAARSPRSGTARSRAKQAGSGGRAAAGLGSTGIVVTAKQNPAASTRTDRLELQTKLRHFADRTLVSCGGYANPMTGEWVNDRMVPKDDKYLGCGRRQREQHGDVTVTLTDGVAGVAGVQTCGSGWSCPVCSGKIQSVRAGDLGKVLAKAREEQHTLVLLTYTVSHRAGDALKDVWDAVSVGWSKVIGGSGVTGWGSESVEDFDERVSRWETACELARDGKGRWPRGGRAGIRPVRRVGDAERRRVIGWARAVEVTHGLNGWHVHVHAVMVLAGDAFAAEGNAHALGESTFRRWLAGIKSAGFTASKRRGIDVQVRAAAAKKLAEYLTKDDFGKHDSAERIRASVGKQGRKLAMEAALGDAKFGKRAGRTPFQVLRDIDYDEPGRDLAIWREWVEYSAGRRALTWSRGFRTWADLEEEQQSDEEAAADERGGLPVLRLQHAAWYLVRDRKAEWLDVVEAGGVPALIDWLALWGVVEGTPERGGWLRPDAGGPN